MNKVRVGIIGCGAIAQRRHAPEYAENKQAEIAGFLDFNRSRAEEMAQQYGGKAYESIDEMLTDETVDAVSVCSPNSTHAEDLFSSARSALL